MTHTGSIAVRTLCGDEHEKGLLRQLEELIQGDPDIAHLQQALQVGGLIHTTLLVWIGSKNLISAAPRRRIP